jgi:predicted DNA-binding ribbon-helix-helix protein
MRKAPPAAERSDLALDPSLALPKKRSLSIAGHRTSITIEDAFWRGLKATAAEMDMSVAALVAVIDTSRGEASLSAAIRVFLFTRTTFYSERQKNKG